MKPNISFYRLFLVILGISVGINFGSAIAFYSGVTISFDFFMLNIMLFFVTAAASIAIVLLKTNKTSKQ